MAAATLWLLVSVALRTYLSHFADYQKTYGAIGGVIVALLWFYVTSLAILIGAQLDATIERASEPAPTAIIPLERDAGAGSSQLPPAPSRAGG